MGPVSWQMQRAQSRWDSADCWVHSASGFADFEGLELSESTCGVYIGLLDLVLLHVANGDLLAKVGYPKFEATKDRPTRNPNYTLIQHEVYYHI